MDEERMRFSAFTKEDNRRLQVLQNKVMRLKTGLPQDTPTTMLLEASSDLSVMQLTAFHTIMTVFRAVISGFPKYLHDKLALRIPGQNDRLIPQRQTHTIQVPNGNLTLSRGGFIFRGATLWNMMPVDLRTEQKVTVFKGKVKHWIKEHIRHKPP